MARARVNLFPQPKQARPSNNVQPVFGRVDPFRRQPQGTTGPLNLGAGGGVATTANEIPGDIGFKNIADRMLRASAGLMPGPTGEPTPTSLDALRVLQEGLGLQAPSVDPAAGLAPADIEAAQLVGGAVAGNPFIGQAGQQRLSQGLLPLFSDIQSGFFRQTDPLIVQQLLALFQGRQIQPESVLSAIESGRPRGFR